MKKLNTFTLTHDQTGQSIRALLLNRPTGGRFMKIWQDTGWESRLAQLQGNSLRVLWYLVKIATWQNVVPGPSEVAQRMYKRQQHISRAYGELIKADFIHKNNGAYQLNPLFCWRGDQQQLEKAQRKLLAASIKALPDPLAISTVYKDGLLVDRGTGEILQDYRNKE